MLHDTDSERIHSAEEINGANELARLRLKLAFEDFESAEDNYKCKRYRAANNRSYYAIYHAINACLALSFESYKQHGQTIGAFNKRYIHTGIFPDDIGRKINRAMLIRHSSDYDDYYEESDDEAHQQLDTAK